MPFLPSRAVLGVVSTLATLYAVSSQRKGPTAAGIHDWLGATIR
jgi:hypothetical protein